MKIVTSKVYPPIPTRDHDWCAHYDGEEEAGGYGWGRTEAEAIADFNENCRDDHDDRLGLVPFGASQQRAQAERCGCKGTDDYCPCQNVPDRITRRENREPKP